MTVRIRALSAGRNFERPPASEALGILRSLFLSLSALMCRRPPWCAASQAADRATRRPVAETPRPRARPPTVASLMRLAARPRGSRGVAEPRPRRPRRRGARRPGPAARRRAPRRAPAARGRRAAGGCRRASATGRRCSSGHGRGPRRGAAAPSASARGPRAGAPERRRRARGGARSSCIRRFAGGKPNRDTHRNTMHAAWGPWR